MFDQKELLKADGISLYHDYESWPEKADRALKKKLFSLKKKRFQKVIICGMGGSASIGDVLKDIALGHSDSPEIAVIKDFNLPSFVTDKMCVLAISYSGNTAETLSLFKEAIKRGCLVIGISSGGMLEERCKKNNLAHVKVDRAVTPRSAFPSLFFTTLKVLESLGNNFISNTEIKRSIKSLKLIRIKNKLDTKSNTNVAKKIAYEILNCNLTICGPIELQGLLIRFKNSLNENTKIGVKLEIMPEMFHNTIESWTGNSSKKDKVVLITPKKCDKNLEKRIKTFKDLSQSLGIPIINVKTSGHSLLEHHLSTLYLLEYVTIYSAIIRKIAPKPTPNINWFKQSIDIPK